MKNLVTPGPWRAIYSAVHDYKRLEVWKKAYLLTLGVYSATRAFPKEETYGLVSQLRRSAVSIASNVAEGTGRLTPPGFCRFLQIALGSAAELEVQLLLARDLSFLKDADHAPLSRAVVEVKRMLVGLLKHHGGFS